MTGHSDAVRQPYDVYASRLEDPMGALSVALGRWERRDDSKAQPKVRQAANEAMDTIDAMLRELHAMRSCLVGEIRVSDDIHGARAVRVCAPRHHRAPAP